MPAVKQATTVPCAATRSCMRNTDVDMVPRCLNLYAPYKQANVRPASPVEKQKNSYAFVA